MKNIFITILLIGLIETPLMATTETTTAAAASEFATMTEVDRGLAEPAWKRHCSKCHGMDGNGPASRMGERLGLSINYTESGALDGFSDEELDAITTNGIEGTKMNGYSKKLSAEEITALTRYMRSLSE